MVLLRVLVAGREAYDIAIGIAVALRQEVAAIDRDGALDTVLSVTEYLGRGRDVVFWVDFE